MQVFCNTVCTSNVLKILVPYFILLLFYCTLLFDCTTEKQQKKAKKTSKLNVSPNRQNIKYFASNLVIEFHAGGARFEITTVLLFVVKNDIETLFFWKQASKSGCALYTGAHYTRVNTVYNLYFKESEGLVVEFV